MQPKAINLTPVQQLAFANQVKLLAQDPAAFEVILLKAILDSSQNEGDDFANQDHEEQVTSFEVPVLVKAKILKDPTVGSGMRHDGDGTDLQQAEPTILMIGSGDPVPDGSIVIMYETLSGENKETKLYIEQPLPLGRKGSGGVKYVCRPLYSAIEELDEPIEDLEPDNEFVWRKD